jgi:hypothetical protein
MNDKTETVSQMDFAPVVQAVFDELDMQQLAVFRQLSGARRIQQVFDLCDWARSLIIASICSQYPNISESELTERILQRIHNEPI